MLACMGRKQELLCWDFHVFSKIQANLAFVNINRLVKFGTSLGSRDEARYIPFCFGADLITLK